MEVAKENIRCFPKVHYTVSPCPWGAVGANAETYGEALLYAEVGAHAVELSKLRHTGHMPFQPKATMSRHGSQSGSLRRVNVEGLFASGRQNNYIVASEAKTASIFCGSMELSCTHSPRLT